MPNKLHLVKRIKWLVLFLIDVTTTITTITFLTEQIGHKVNLTLAKVTAEKVYFRINR